MMTFDEKAKAEIETLNVINLKLYELFPDAVWIHQNGFAYDTVQLLGADFTLMTGAGQIIHVDVKSRGRDFGDVLFEHTVVTSGGTRLGYAERAHLNSILLIYYKDTGRFEYLEMATFQRLWFANKKQWIAKAKTKTGGFFEGSSEEMIGNRKQTRRFVCVPRREYFAALYREFEKPTAMEDIFSIDKQNKNNE